jgi:hypothetical protein
LGQLIVEFGIMLRTYGRAELSTRRTKPNGFDCDGNVAIANKTTKVKNFRELDAARFAELLA